MYEFKPISDRVAKMRKMYRDTKPEICTARYRLVTEFYMGHPELGGILRRAKAFRYICENIPCRIDEGEVIVGAQSAKYRAAAIYPETSIDPLPYEIETNIIQTRKGDPYIISEEDGRYILDTCDYWRKECNSAKVDAYILDGFFEHVGSGATTFREKDTCTSPVGHFCAGYNKAITVGFGAIKREADGKMAKMEDRGVFGDSIKQYNFYRAVSIVCEGMITLTKRYAALAREKFDTETDPVRKEELGRMVDTLEWCMENPARNFLDAIMTLFMYQTCLCLDGNMHGISFGRVDQYLYPYYESDLAKGDITPEYAQELIDLFLLKISEHNKFWGDFGGMGLPGYTSGQLVTLGGVNPEDGTDASNDITLMMLEGSGRLKLHEPPQALRIHKGTPERIWRAAIATTKVCGGVPSFENDEVIVPALMKRGLTLESARNYCLLGCVEPGGCGDEWPACGGTGTESYINLVGVLWLALNNGINPMPEQLTGFMKFCDGQTGPATGYLYEMETFDDVLAAFKVQCEFFVKWHASNINSFEYVSEQNLPLPVVSCTIEGCMESGKDVMSGGARFNSTGIAGIGIGNVGDSLQMIKRLCFDEGKCTTRELYDALMSDWKGYEGLQAYIRNDCPHYGNGIEECDVWTGWAAKIFSDAVNSCTGPRGRFSAGLYPVTAHVAFGKITAATPDGRNLGDALADGISPLQGMDKNGPTALLSSISHIDQVEYPNGTLLNMKFHPSSVSNDLGVEKLQQLIETYFNELGGMEVQINVVGADTLRAAQARPDEYRDLVVRIAGFSVYFVEMHKAGQDDLISRTEIELT